MTNLLCSSMQNLTLRQGLSCAPSRRPLSMARCGSRLSSSQSAFAAESRLVAQQPSQASVQQACVVTCKLKTRKAAAKRYKVTGSGKVVIRHPGKQHINEKKSSKRLSQLGKAHCVSDRHLPGIIGNLPYKRIKKSGN